MSLETSKELIRRSVEEFYNRGDMNAIDGIYAADYVQHEPSGNLNLEQFKENAKGLFSGLPDLTLTIDGLIAEGDKVTKRWTARCTHTGEYLGIPATGNKLEVTGISIYRVANGKLAECWHHVDALTMMQQLGVIPPMG